MAEIRLDKLIADNSSYSRKEVNKLIKSKRVEVNGELASNGNQKVALNAQVSIDGEMLATAVEVDFLVLHKPAGYVCTHEDANYPTIFDLLPPQYRRFQAVGRLDLDTTGLIFLTSDGQVNHRLTSPKKDIPKTYRVWLEDPIEDFYAQAIEDGIQLKGEKEACRPGKLEVLDHYCCDLTISEGKYHQVKRMFAALGNKVTELHRHRLGKYDLPEDLEPGEFLELSTSEALPHIIP